MGLLSAAAELPVGRLLALDLGQVRIGVAVCDEAGMLASPLTVLRRQDTRAADFAAIAHLAGRERVVGILVGLPANDADGRQARWTRRYAGRLAGALPQIPVAFWDESLSSVDAAQLLAEAGRRGALDAAAAAVILESFLTTRRNRE